MAGGGGDWAVVDSNTDTLPSNDNSEDNSIDAAYTLSAFPKTDTIVTKTVITTNNENVTSPLLQDKLIQTVEGVNYFTYGHPDLEVLFRRVHRELPLRDDDVIITGFPRSGHHWTFEIVNMVLHQNTEFGADHFSKSRNFADF